LHLELRLGRLQHLGAEARVLFELLHEGGPPAPLNVAVHAIDKIKVLFRHRLQWRGLQARCLLGTQKTGFTGRPMDHRHPGGHVVCSGSTVADGLQSPANTWRSMTDDYFN
jgi:hypothetical protein